MASGSFYDKRARDNEICGVPTISSRQYAVRTQKYSGVYVKTHTNK